MVEVGKAPDCKNSVSEPPQNSDADPYALLSLEPTKERHCPTKRKATGPGRCVGGFVICSTMDVPAAHEVSKHDEADDALLACLVELDRYLVQRRTLQAQMKKVGAAISPCPGANLPPLLCVLALHATAFRGS